MRRKIRLIFLLVLFLFPPTASAQTPQVKPAMTLTGTVPTEVSLPNSSYNVSPTETLADPANHVIIITVTLRDSTNNPLANLYVEVTSNRGEIDLFRVLSGPDNGFSQNGTIRGRSDAAGIVTFSVGSYLPGEATLKIVADSLAELGNPKITFLPLPFPAQITVTIPIPFSQEKLKIIEPKEEITPEMKEAKRLANIGTEIVIPFWLFALAVLWIVLIPLFIVLIALSIRKIRRTERREMMLLGAIAEAEHIDRVREFLKKEGIGK